MKKSNRVKIVKSTKGLTKDLPTTIKTKVNLERSKKESDKSKKSADIIQSQINNLIHKQNTKRDTRLPNVGTSIIRKYKGENITVKVLENGFEYQGKVYKSISSLAVSIVGCPISGYVFFKLGKKNEH